MLGSSRVHEAVEFVVRHAAFPKPLLSGCEISVPSLTASKTPNSSASAIRTSGRLMSKPLKSGGEFWIGRSSCWI
jgi:hypothetical protein